MGIPIEQKTAQKEGNKSFKFRLEAVHECTHYLGELFFFDHTLTFVVFVDPVQVELSALSRRELFKIGV